jgi:hypothetical protein
VEVYDNQNEDGSDHFRIVSDITNRGVYHVLATVKRYIRIASVRLLSIMSVSFENRFVIRPRGVVSKNDIGARRVRFIARLSITLLEVVPAIVSVTEYKNMRSACVAPKATYVPI